MLFALTILIHFGGNLINCNEDIPICDEQLKQLKEDVKDWEKRCVNESLENLDEMERYFTESQRSDNETQRYFNERRRENNSSGCTAEKEYLQERMRMHSEMCFYDGPYPEQYMFLAKDTAILAVDLTTLDATVVVGGKRNIWTLDIDMKNKKIYFAELDKEIRRANYDGTSEEIVVKDAKTRRLTIDWIGRRIFWSDWRKNIINVATLDGKDSRTLIKTLEPLDIAIDPIEGYLFWIEYNGGKVMRRHLAAKKEKQVYGFNRNGVYYLALDYNRKRVYTYERRGTDNVIIEMDYDGRNSNQTTNYGSAVVGGMMSVDVIGDFLYWKERISPIVIKMNVTSRNISRYIPLPKGFDVRKLLVVDKDRQPEGGCQNVSCRHGYCLNINGTDKCHCDNGTKYDGESCTDIDECLSSPCINHTGFLKSCNNTPGSYVCMCENGIYINGRGCAANSELKIRLNGSSNNNNMSGRVEIYHPTLGWGTVCYWREFLTGMKITDGNVTCRQLGFSGATEIRPLAHYGKGSGYVLLSNVQCSGDESFIWDCSHNGWNNPPWYCDHGRDVGVDCY
ncbi:low-density lipoprotein receptor-related protein 1B-like [Dendronephthya gigantea]|uniref:low-density lipoprotein receptor-related protein 1B-like n=1 Tax=Dendronephthya gigantea TaxID=151771 RepID=UPI00106B0C60|nr:low-density lipoprotein receptor-related protein 1B-like [Dendronephthya gigantea]